MNFNSIDIEIGGKTRKMVATMANIYDIENNLGSVFSLIKKTMPDGPGLKIKEIIGVIFYSLNGNPENRLQIESVEKEIFEKGYMSYIGKVQEFLLVSLSGGDAQKKPDAENGETVTPQDPTN